MWWGKEFPCDFPECPPGFTWLVIPFTESNVADIANVEQDVDEHNFDCSVFVPPLVDEDEPEIKEYMQVQMEEVCVVAAWENCSGGCGAELKATLAQGELESFWKFVNVRQGS